jgi:hypothetical protein
MDRIKCVQRISRVHSDKSVLLIAQSAGEADEFVNQADDISRWIAAEYPDVETVEITVLGDGKYADFPVANIGLNLRPKLLTEFQQFGS